MSGYGSDIYADPPQVSLDTLASLGPLAPLAGVWEGERGVDIAPKAAGPRTQGFFERISLEPVDPGNNGPQLLYALRYHTWMCKPGEKGTYHDQVGYWLWEPATETVMHSLTIPRGQTVLAVGNAKADARTFTLEARRGTTDYGICSNPFLEENFRTDSFTITVTVHDDGTWSYEEDTVMMIKGQTERFHHRDSNRLHRVAAPTPNPLAG
ncbi:FABP family protein [Novosphingobium sp. TH158]|uniref:FABP family protein n=1 Tax=Novosphingobium sp. TH158 TaxID=2067455 RepID=UPI000C7C8169|nr:heme-binding beta-barrel domain-containing protein [Novosphingobium sp. TH158]PLK27693.1 FABP family protein [Novosphingobium sp. TH158]